MNAGDTLTGLDTQNHLWIIITVSVADGSAVVANLTTHDQARKTFCNRDCVVVRPGEPGYPSRDSCVYYRDAFLTEVSLLQRGLDNRTYFMNDPLSEELLDRIQQGALQSPQVSEPVKAAIRQDAQ